MKTYLFIYSDAMGNRDALKAAIAGIPEIIRWRYDIPNSFYIYSDASPDAVHLLFHADPAGKQAEKGQ